MLFRSTWEAVDMIRADMIHVDDSRDLFATVFDLANKFENKMCSDDYISDVSEFARKELLDQYG